MRPPLNNRAVFLDRDGTINEEVGYLSDPGLLKLIDGAPEALRSLQKAGFKLIVVTNQSGAERGYFTEDDVKAVNSRLVELLEAENLKLDQIYYCLHLECKCRKPNTGMIEKAMKDHGVDPKRSYVVGDKASDMKLARNAGAVGIMVMTGFGAGERANVEGQDFEPAVFADNILQAARWIIERERTPVAT